MSKEITLSELLATNQGTKVNAQPVEPKPTVETKTTQNNNPDIKTAKTVSSPNFNGSDGVSKKVSIDEIAKTLPGKPVEEIKNPEIVDDAFKAMHETIAERKRIFEEEVVPVMEQNAREMAMEKQMEEMGVSTGDEIDSDEEDILDRITDAMDEDIINEEIAGMNEEVREESTMVIPEAPVIQKPTEPVQKEEAQPRKKASPSEKDVTELENEESSLDELLKELDDPMGDDDLDDGDFDEETVEETRDRLKSNISKVIQPSKIDFSEYSVRVKPLAVSAVLNNISSHKVIKSADWALLGSKRSITVTEATGPELDALVKSIRNSNAVNAAIMSLKLIYNHIVDANKPPFETWARSIHTEDLDSLYYALYKATYADTNMIAYRCEKPDDEKYGCKKTSVLSVDVEKMVKFETPEVEEEFKALLLKDTTTEDMIERPSLLALSNDIAITYNVPNLYSTLIQYSTLNPKIVDKYDELLNTLAYIDGFFYIDHATKELVPMPVKQYPNNLNKTVLEKLKLYGQILKTLTSDEYDMALAKLSNLGEGSKVTYVNPEVTCPECGSTIPEETITNMLDMVFNRRQLAQIQGL